jgi:hypothetical protein
MPERLVVVEKQGAKFCTRFLLRLSPPLWRTRRSSRRRWRQRATRS